MNLRRSPARVRAHAGYRGEQEPRTLEVDGRRLEIAIVRRWRAPEGSYFEVQVRDGGRLVLLCREPELSWWRVG